MNEEPHKLMIVLWDIPSQVAAGRPFTIKIGAKCSAECQLADGDVEVQSVRAQLDSIPLPGTTALYWVELELVSPSQAGSFVWDVKCSEPKHEDGCTPLTLTVVPSPDHTVRITVTEDGIPIPGLEIRLGRYRSSSDEAGRAAMDVPKGSYELNVWKEGYEHLSRNINVVADTEVNLNVAKLPPEEDPYWM
jgi:uncharacterized membrane protein